LLFVIGYSGEEKRGLKYLGMNSFGMDDWPDEMRFTFVKCARPPQLSESDGGQASLYR